MPNIVKQVLMPGDYVSVDAKSYRGVIFKVEKLEDHLVKVVPTFALNGIAGIAPRMCYASMCKKLSLTDIGYMYVAFGSFLKNIDTL